MWSYVSVSALVLVLMLVLAMHPIEAQRLNEFLVGGHCLLLYVGLCMQHYIRRILLAVALRAAVCATDLLTLVFLHFLAETRWPHGLAVVFVRVTVHLPRSGFIAGIVFVVARAWTLVFNSLH